MDIDVHGPCGGQNGLDLGLDLVEHRQEVQRGRRVQHRVRQADDLLVAQLRLRLLVPPVQLVAPLQTGVRHLEPDHGRLDRLVEKGVVAGQLIPLQGRLVVAHLEVAVPDGQRQREPVDLAQVGHEVERKLLVQAQLVQCGGGLPGLVELRPELAGRVGLEPQPNDLLVHQDAQLGRPHRGRGIGGDRHPAGVSAPSGEQELEPGLSHGPVHGGGQPGVQTLRHGAAQAHREVVVCRPEGSSRRRRVPAQGMQHADVVAHRRHLAGPAELLVRPLRRLEELGRAVGVALLQGHHSEGRLDVGVQGGILTGVLPARPLQEGNRLRVRAEPQILRGQPVEVAGPRERRRRAGASKALDQLGHLGLRIHRRDQGPVPGQVAEARHLRGGGHEPVEHVDPAQHRGRLRDHAIRELRMQEAVDERVRRQVFGQRLLVAPPEEELVPTAQMRLDLPFQGSGVVLRRPLLHTEAGCDDAVAVERAQMLCDHHVLPSYGNGNGVRLPT